MIMGTVYIKSILQQNYITKTRQFAPKPSITHKYYPTY
ncbi:hypothetical protein MPF_1479 [Methanohalophilus portucalensis FDF-1]|uniref:Uncharacterized protein n=1 Tax=Methanohalophilus portucalensis FDF-1 TaxID=523843 RepID=A0A1L9C3B4_9EURY|nr:hypothetical protein MPF_1479 [Methanohalophilus portucalensis FDF-1]